MGETIAVLIVFFFLLVISAAFYVNFAQKNIVNKGEEFAELEALNVMKRVLSLPELHCSKNNIVRESCVDKQKLSQAGAVIANHQLAYFDTFGYTKITVEELYDSSATLDTAVVLYDNELTNFQRVLPARIPISLYDPVSGEYSFGLVTIETYS